MRATLTFRLLSCWWGNESKIEQGSRNLEFQASNFWEERGYVRKFNTWENGSKVGCVARLCFLHSYEATRLRGYEAKSSLILWLMHSLIFYPAWVQTNSKREAEMQGYGLLPITTNYYFPARSLAFLHDVKISPQA